MEPRDFFSFDKMLTPLIIKILFWLGVGLSVLGGLFMIIAGLFTRFGGGSMVIMGLFYLVLGPILSRIYCELLIIVFKIHENLVDIKNALSSRPSPPLEPPISAAAPE